MLFRQLFHAGSATYAYLLGSEDARTSILIEAVIDNRDMHLPSLPQLRMHLPMSSRWVT